MSAVLWPLRGLVRFLAAPALWWRPLVVTAALALGLGVVAGAVLWWRWPGSATTGWHAWLGGAAALGQAVAAVLLCWLVAAPLVIGLALDALVRQVQRRHGAGAAVELSAGPALFAGLRVVGGTLAPRLLCGLGGATLGWCAGPAGAVLASFGLAYLACLDALDSGLAARGLDGAHRLAALRAHRAEVVVAGVVAGALGLALAATVVGWLLWLPALMVGAATRVLTWPEAADESAGTAVGAAPALSPPRPPSSPA